MKSLRAVRLFLLALVVFLAASPLYAIDPVTLRNQLLALPNVTAVTQVTSPAPPAGTYFYRISFRQPVDHNNPLGPTFTQRVTLLHRDETKPVVLVTDGYSTSSNPTQQELTFYLQSNQVRVEHRFFVASTPNPADWSKLDIWQSASDLHAISQSLKGIYSAGWVSTGASKSGMTATYYRYYFPDDVKATVPYVAPSSHGTSDARYVTFLNNVGPADCRTALRNFQKAALQKRDQIVPLIPDYDSYDVFGKDRALEFAVLELPFAFWQYGDQTLCPLVPAPTASPQELLDFIDMIIGMVFYGDSTLDFYKAYFYQSATQLGGPKYDERSVRTLLRYPGEDIPELYPPLGVPKTFDPNIMPKVEQWVRAKGKHFVFIYGANDPWSTGPFDVKPANDSYRYFVYGDGGNHGASLTRLSQAERDFILAKLNTWLGVPMPLQNAARAATRSKPEFDEPTRQELFLR